MVELTEDARQIIEAIYGPVGRAGTKRLQKYTDQELALLRDFLREGQALQVEHAARIRSGGTPDLD
jgi:hypothetical protein